MINDSINRFLGVLCYPFLSGETFYKDYIQEYIGELNKPERDQKKLQGVRDRLKTELIGYIRKQYYLYSYDEIYLYLEKCYLYHAENYENALQLYQYVMRKMAITLISHRDGRIVFKYWKNKDDEALFGGFAGGNKVTLFHSLSCHMPMDFIAIIYMVINQKEPDIGCLEDFYGNIEVADQQLARVLEKGVAENHLHKGVSRTFSSIWDSLMEPVTANKIKEFRHKEFVNGTREENRHMLFLILGCGIVRAWLALRLSVINLFGYCQNDVEEAAAENEKDDNGEMEEIEKLVEAFGAGQKFEELYAEKFREQEESDIILYYAGLWEILERRMPENAFQGQLCERLFLKEKIWLHTFDENIFLYHALYAFFGEKVSYELKRCIMQYLRVRNRLFHTSVQQKTIKGLDYFQQAHYSVNSALNHINTKNFWENAIREQFQNPDLHKVEFRTSMPESYSGFKREVVKFLEAYWEILRESYYDEVQQIPYRRIPQVGLVIHFLKRPDETSPEKCVQNGRENCSYLQFGKLQESYEKQIDAFVQLRSEFSELSRYLVGIDAASLENSTPVWVFAPIYEKARDSSVERIGRSSRSEGHTQSLGFTFHAGEDFRHILSGLRRIDEAVEYLKFHAGDRIGHGIALGMQARIWQKQNPVIIIPQIEALENYLWAYDMLSKNYSDFQAAVLSYMEQRVFELAGRIYGTSEKTKSGELNGITIETLLSGYRGLFDGAVKNVSEETRGVLEEKLCKKVWSGESIYWDAELLVAARHCKNFVRKMEEPIHYEVTEQDLLIIEELQKMLKEKLGRKGIVIEVNPSSNTAIADIDIPEENQFYQMNRPNHEQNLIVCVNSDDPAVFNTNVSNELAYIYYGMLDRNVSREAALHWIERIRTNGLNSSFIHHKETEEVLVQNLRNLLGKI